MSQDVVRQLPKHKRYERAGRIGGYSWFQFHDKTNRNGKLLLSLIKECELVSISTLRRVVEGMKSKNSQLLSLLLISVGSLIQSTGETNGNIEGLWSPGKNR